MTVQSVEKSDRSKPEPLAAGRFGIWPGTEPRPYHPADCPSLEQFEAHFNQANDEREPAVNS